MKTLSIECYSAECRDLFLVILNVTMLSVFMLAPLTLGQDTFSTKGPGMYHVFLSKNIWSTDIRQTFISLTNTVRFGLLMTAAWPNRLFCAIRVDQTSVGEMFFDEMAHSETMMARSFVNVHLGVSSLVFKSSSEAILSST
jgi:hypothetical protein